MDWSELISLFIIILLIGWGFRLMRENSALKKENVRLLKKTGEYEEMKQVAKESLKNTTDVKTVKLLREQYGLSLIEAKKIVDSVK